MTVNKKAFRNAEKELALLLLLPQALLTAVYWPSTEEGLRTFAFTQTAACCVFACVAWWRYRNNHKHTHRPFVWAIMQSFVFAMVAAFITDGTLKMWHLSIALLLPWVIVAVNGLLIISNPLRFTKVREYDGEGFPVGRSRRIDRMLSAAMGAFILGQLFEFVYKRQVDKLYPEKPKTAQT